MSNLGNWMNLVTKGQITTKAITTTRMILAIATSIGICATTQRTRPTITNATMI